MRITEKCHLWVISSVDKPPLLSSSLYLHCPAHFLLLWPLVTLLQPQWSPGWVLSLPLVAIKPPFIPCRSSYTQEPSQYYSQPPPNNMSLTLIPSLISFSFPCYPSPSNKQQSFIGLVCLSSTQEGRDLLSIDAGHTTDTQHMGDVQVLPKEK
jgi:hypothetical protein